MSSLGDSCIGNWVCMFIFLRLKAAVVALALALLISLFALSVLAVYAQAARQSAVLPANLSPVERDAGQAGPSFLSSISRRTASDTATSTRTSTPTSTPTDRCINDLYSGPQNAPRNSQTILDTY